MPSSYPIEAPGFKSKEDEGRKSKSMTRTRIGGPEQVYRPPSAKYAKKGSGYDSNLQQMGSDSFDDTTFDESRSKHYSRREIISMSTVDSEGLLSGDDGFVIVRQRIAYLCILVTAIQLALLLTQLILCGVASLDINPMIGPYPDAYSEWGGKNAYLMLVDRQYFRLITPVFLNVGVLHFLVNAFCQLETCAFFERENGDPVDGRFYT